MWKKKGPLSQGREEESMSSPGEPLMASGGAAWCWADGTPLFY